jgi:hypothetical protein
MSTSSCERPLAKHAQHDTHNGLVPNLWTTSFNDISAIGARWSFASGVHRKTLDMVHGTSSHRICQNDSSMASNTARVKCEAMYDGFSSFFFRRLPSGTVTSAAPSATRALTKLIEPNAFG